MEPREVRLALPHLAVGGLSENWLFKEAGDLHWQLLSEHFGVPVEELRDPAGDRVLPVFVRVRLESEQPLSVFAEGDEVALTGELSRIDEHTFTSDVQLLSDGRRLTARLMTVLVKRGAEGSLTPVAPPATGGVTGAVDEQLLRFQREFHEVSRSGPESGGEGGLRYELNPYHDLNAAGLLYFASYPHINDHCERLDLRAAGRGPAGDWSSAASTVSRDVYYLGNCGPDDTVVYRLDACDFDGDTAHLASTLLRERDGTPLARIRTTKQFAERPASVEPPAPAPVEGPRPDPAALLPRLRPVMAQVLDVPAEELGDGTDLRLLGLDSFALSAFASRATSVLGTEVDPSRLFLSFTLADLARTVAQEPAATPKPAAPLPERRASGRDEEIAVVGMAGRFPGADSVGELWRVLCEERDVLSEIPADRWDWHAGEQPPARGGFLRDIRRFDHAFFRVSRREAALIDPQQRLFLEVAWEAFEDAGHDVTRLRGTRTGVFAGVCHNDYAAVLRETRAGAEPHRSVATSPSIVAGRVSHAFGFHGPSVAVDTLCSSSLVAVDQAVRALRDGSCEQALVGGVNVICDPGQYEAYARAGVLSDEGRCRTFDAGADGYARGEGVCALVLKPLGRARADGDRILAVVKSVATNHGGDAQSLTAPNPEAQSALVRQAYEQAGVDPATVGYLEAHGTGTVLGDPIEVSGLVDAFRRLRLDRGQPQPEAPYCGLGSVKTNIGHLEAAAGIAGMIKVMLAMRHGELPATAHFSALNHRIDLEGSPFRVQRERAPWRRAVGSDGATAPRLAGVSSFGMGGTNAHVVLEEYRDAAEPDGATAPAGPHVLPLSARTPDALEEAVGGLLEFLAEEDRGPLADIAYTLQVGRAAMEERLAVVASTPEEVVSALRGHLAGERDESGVLGSGRTSAAGERARRWVAGGEPDWEEGAGGGAYRRRRVPLPTYPFRREQHWAAAPAAAREDEAAGGQPEFLVESWTADGGQRGEAAPGNYLVLVNEESEQAGCALFGSERDGRRGIVVRAAELAARPPVLDALLPEGEQLAGLVDLADWWPQERPGDAAPVLRRRVRLLQEVLARHRMPSLTCLHVVRGPLAAEAAGLYRMLSGEFRTVRSRTVDVDFGPDEPEALAPLVADELARDDRQTRVRHRAGRREYAALRALGPSERAAAAARPSPLDEAAAGTVVITGGTGAIGLRLAAELHRRGAPHLLLIGRSRLPARAKWAEQAANPRTEPKLAARLRALLELTERGASVEVRTHALSDAASLARLLEAARQRHGALSAVFHCAGAMDDARSLLAKTPEGIQRILDPKVRGVRTLWEALSGQPPGLLVLFSSVSAAVPRLAAAYGDYAAANAFLDDFALAHADGAGTGWTTRSLQWPVWEGTGLGEGRGEAAVNLGFAGLDGAEALELLDGALAVAGHRVVLPYRGDVAVPPSTLREAPVAVVSPAEQGDASAPAESGASVDGAGTAPPWVTEVLARTLRVPAEELADTASLADLGLDSLLLAELVKELEGVLGEPVDPVLVQENPTPAGLAAALAERSPAAVRQLSSGGDPGPRAATSPGASAESTAPTPLTAGAPCAAAPTGPVPVAVIGMACRFPGAAGTDAYWRNLVEGRSRIAEVPPDRWDVGAFYSPDGGPGRSVSKWGGFIEDAALFDPGYFGFDERTARHLDPLARKALEVSAECLRDAGYREDGLKGRGVGVYLGTRAANYREHLRPLPREAIVGLGQNFIAAHLSHFFDLSGPNLVVDSACSSSLVTVHLACQSLAAGESELALAGGVDLLLDEDPYLLLSEGKALSPTGRCHTFDEAADGFVPGEGAGMLLLKRLDEAERDGDRVLAVIEAGAVNNDGHTMGYTTPSARAQTELIHAALERGGIDPRTIGHVEAHGTGTMVGDPIELQALTTAFRRRTADTEFCGVGSVKTNIGHLLSAAGVAGVIKTVLALRHQQLPPTLNCARPNPRFAFSDSPFYPVTERRDAVLERAAVSSFGFGGTNAHLILRRAPDTAPVADHRQPLPPPVYRRQPFWPQRKSRPAGPDPARRGAARGRHRSARLELTFPPTG